MPQTWQLVILGIVQGLTEFLPVSSSAHLVFAEAVLGLQRPGVLLEAVVHLGTVVAVLLVYGRDLWRVLGAWSRRPWDTAGSGRLVWLLAVTTAVTGVGGYVFREPLEASFASVRWTAVQLVATGVILWVAKERSTRAAGEMTWQDAGWIGLAQAVAIVPGISRSGITIAAGLWRGLGREEAARYSFFASVPAILGAGAYSVANEWQAAASSGYTLPLVAAAFVAALASGVAAILWLVGVVRRGRLRAFSYYCWTVGAAVFVLSWVVGTP
ncbi:MAG: undecaprenyl-diphosphate phosphatase [Armatimonadota bacterium]|nr:undecaprenyl-diphosphate phosphatase [Armatimonadota bacterium]MDW8157078.1 undecaprenyl-diphosphate phosphatase [Armatimonadota bacterium]